MAQPALIVGLGGAGQLVVRDVKRLLLEAYGGRIPPWVRLLALDTVQRSEAFSGSGVTLEPGEYIYFGSDVSDFVREMASGRHPHISSWFQSEYYLRMLPQAMFQLQMGAGQLRQFGRLALFYDLRAPSISRIYGMIRDAIGRVRTATEADLRVLLITSLVGGTGAGILIDIAHLLQTVSEAEFGTRVSVSGYLILPAAFQWLPGPATHGMNARAFAALRELARFQSWLDLDIGYPMHYHSRSSDPIWGGHRRSILFDELYFFDGQRDHRPLNTVPLQYGISPLIADAICLTLDESAGKELSRRFINVRALGAGEAASALAPLGGTLGIVSLSLPVHHLMIEWAHRLALEILDVLLAPSERSPSTGVPTKLAIDANMEAGKSTRGREEALRFLSSDRIRGVLGAVELTLLTAEVARIATLDEEVARSELTSRSFQDWLALLEFPRAGEEVIRVPERLLRLADSTSLITQVQTSSKLGEAPTVGVQRIERQIGEIKQRLLGVRLSDGSRKQGEIQLLLSSLANLQLERFRRALRIQLCNMLNGVSEDPLVARAGKLGYTSDFLNGLIAGLDRVLRVLNRTRELQEREHLRREIETRVVDLFSEMKRQSGRRLLFLHHPVAFRSQEHYIVAEQTLLNAELANIACQIVVETVRQILDYTQIIREEVATWAAALATSQDSLYAEIALRSLGALKEQREREQQFLSQLTIRDDDYEGKRYEYYAEGIGKDWRARLLETIQWFLDEPGTTVSSSRERLTLAIGDETYSADQMHPLLDALIERCLQAFSSAASTESILSLLAAKYTPNELAELLYKNSEVALGLSYDVRSAYPVSQYLAIGHTSDPQLQTYLDEVLKRLSMLTGGREASVETLPLSDRTKCIFVRYLEQVDLTCAQSFKDARAAYVDAQLSSESAGLLLHVFPAEVNSVQYERRHVAEFRGSYHLLDPRVVALLEYPEHMALFARAYAHGLVRKESTEKSTRVVLDFSQDVIALTKENSPEVLLYEALQTFVYRRRDIRSDIFNPIDYRKLERACTRAQQLAGRVEENIAILERFEQEVVKSLENSTDPVEQGVGAVLHLSVLDEIRRVQRLGHLGLQFFSLWDNYEVADFTERVHSFAMHLSRACGCPLLDISFSTGEWHLYALDIAAVLSGLALPSSVLPLLFLQRDNLAKHDLEQMRELLIDHVGHPGKIAFLVVFGEPDAIESTHNLLSTTMKRAYAYDVVCPTRSELQQLVTTEDAPTAFRHLMLSNIDLTTVSPYHIVGPTPDNMFFGREQELRKITEHTATASYAIIGGRRIGKTSILGRLHRVRLPLTGFRTLHYQCQKLPQTEPTRQQFLKAVAHEWVPGLTDFTPLPFADILAQLSSDNPLVVLIDETDRLIPADQAAGWPLFGELRALAESGRCQFVFAGERTLREAMKRGKSPLFNFTNMMLIGCLDFPAVEELVTRPMKQLEIELTDEAGIVQLIWDATSGHPNVVQRLCQRLILRLNERRDRRLTPDDVEAVVADPTFQRDDFYDVYLEQATVLERILPLVLAQDGNEPYTLSGVCRLLDERLNLIGPNGRKPRAAEVDAALRRLTDLRSILAYTPQGYVFAVKAFPLVISQWGQVTVEDELMILTEKYRDYGDLTEDESEQMERKR